VGIFLVLAPLSEFANIVPFLGEFISGGIGCVLAVFAAMTAAVLSLITIAIAWLFYRPLLAVGFPARAAGGWGGVGLVIWGVWEPGRVSRDSCSRGAGREMINQGRGAPRDLSFRAFGAAAKQRTGTTT